MHRVFRIEEFRVDVLCEAEIQYVMVETVDGSLKLALRQLMTAKLAASTAVKYFTAKTKKH